MSDRSTSRPKRPKSASRPSPSDAAASGMAAPSGPEIAGLAATATRSGDDARRRGWFWHWNSIVTQYAPLIGLKGVGLLNSYTVWTDRREESPHRGFAFPSQQSEADFYGEDRAELITINKLLVALDLIEIRKEMVLRVDEQGRRWKVPHNFYRVKDHGDDAGLSATDVLRVAELADRDPAVYRYTRRVFSPKFAPIDRDNIWVRILAEVRQTDVWQRLTERTSRDEQRASARTRAGHAARKGGFFVPEVGDTAAGVATANDSTAARIDQGERTSVASTNTGTMPDVGTSNTGFDEDSPTSVEAANGGWATAVAPSNRTYNESSLTTTTTTESPETSRISEVTTAPQTDVDSTENPSQRPVTGPETVVTGLRGAGPAGAAPVDLPGEASAIQAFEDANGRASSPAERQILRGLAERFDPTAAAANVPGRESGWSWVAAAVYEAVEAGSAYVAPRRLREILTRWERDGFPGQERAADRGIDEAESPAPARSPRERGDAPAAYALAEGEDFELPHGFGSRRTWGFTVSLLAAALAPERLAELVHGTAIAGYANGEVTIAATSADQARLLTVDYGALVARKLGEAMRRPVRIAAIVPAERTVAPAQEPETSERGRAVRRDGARDTRAAGAGREPEFEPAETSFIVAEVGLPSAQVWAAVLDELTRAGAVSPANIDIWLRSTRLLGRGDGGRLIVGAAHPIAQQRIASRFAMPLQAAVAAVLGAPAPLDIVVAREWLLAHAPRPELDGAA